MHDDVDLTGDGRVARDPVLGDIPVVGDVGEILVADDDQQIEVVLIAGLGLVHPVIAGVGAEQYYLVYLAAPLVRLGGPPDRRLELVDEDLPDALELALLLFGQMVEIVAHALHPRRRLLGCPARPGSVAPPGWTGHFHERARPRRSRTRRFPHDRNASWRERRCH